MSNNQNPQPEEKETTITEPNETPDIIETGNWDDHADAATQLTEEKSLQDKLDEALAENKKMKDTLLHALADAENTRKRAERQIADTRIFALTSFSKELLSVVDNLRRALLSISQTEHDEKTKNILTGIEMTEKELTKILNKNNIKEIDALHSTFDPNLHEAMFEVPNPEVATGTILNIVEPGWMIGERLLRPARVGISTGGEKAPSKKKKAEEENSKN